MELDGLPFRHDNTIDLAVDIKEKSFSLLALDKGFFSTDKSLFQPIVRGMEGCAKVYCHREACVHLEGNTHAAKVKSPAPKCESAMLNGMKTSITRGRISKVEGSLGEQRNKKISGNLQMLTSLAFR